jgi:hypothetical protein
VYVLMGIHSALIHSPQESCRLLEGIYTRGVSARTGT